MARPRIGFDASACDAHHSPGVRRVARTLLEVLERRGVLEVVRLAPPPGASLARWRQGELARAVAREGLVGLHSFTSSVTLRGRGRRVQTVHELPWRHGVRENAGIVHRAWHALGRCRADAVLCPSEHVARDLGAGARVHVVPWGVADLFAPEPPPGVVDEPLLARHRLGGDPIVLCPGAVRAKKNLAAVLHGVAALKRRGAARVQVVVTGEETPDLRRDLGLAQRLGLGDRLATLGFVEEQELPALLRLSAVVPQLAPSEGFGLCVLEALACGTPVLVPPATAQAEVAGEAGLRVDPADPEAVADGLADAIARREALRFTLPERARAFPWSRTAERVEALWESLA